MARSACNGRDEVFKWDIVHGGEIQPTEMPETNIEGFCDVRIFVVQIRRSMIPTYRWRKLYLILGEIDYSRRGRRNTLLIGVNRRDGNRYGIVSVFAAICM